MNTHMPLTYKQQKALLSNLNPNRVDHRKQGNRDLSYLMAWDIKATLIKVFGFGGFSAEADKCEIMMIENNIPKTEWVDRKKVNIPIKYSEDGQIVFGTANFRVTARCRVKLTIHQTGAVYTEWASASQTGPDIGEVADFAIKTAESDALKRAAIYLGTQMGLSLYNNGGTQDVVKVILAPDQEWPRDPPEVEQVQRIIEGVGDDVSEEDRKKALDQIEHTMGMKRASDLKKDVDTEESTE